MCQGEASRRHTPMWDCLELPFKCCAGMRCILEASADGLPRDALVHAESARCLFISGGSRSAVLWHQ